MDTLLLPPGQGWPGVSPAALRPPAHTKEAAQISQSCLVRSPRFLNSTGSQDCYPAPTAGHEGAVPGTHPREEVMHSCSFLALCARNLPAEEACGAARKSLQRLQANKQAAKRKVSWKLQPAPCTSSTQVQGGNEKTTSLPLRAQPLHRARAACAGGGAGKGQPREGTTTGGT